MRTLGSAFFCFLTCATAAAAPDVADISSKSVATGWRRAVSTSFRAPRGTSTLGAVDRGSMAGNDSAARFRSFNASLSLSTVQRSIPVEVAKSFKGQLQYPELEQSAPSGAPHFDQVLERFQSQTRLLWFAAKKNYLKPSAVSVAVNRPADQAFNFSFVFQSVDGEYRLGTKGLPGSSVDVRVTPGEIHLKKRICFKFSHGFSDAERQAYLQAVQNSLYKLDNQFTLVERAGQRRRLRVRVMLDLVDESEELSGGVETIQVVRGRSLGNGVLASTSTFPKNCSYDSLNSTVPHELAHLFFAARDEYRDRMAPNRIIPRRVAGKAPLLRSLMDSIKRNYLAQLWPSSLRHFAKAAGIALGGQFAVSCNGYTMRGKSEPDQVLGVRAPAVDRR